VRVGEGDKLYGSVTNSMVGDALAEQGIEIDKRKILMEAPLRALGDYEVLVKLHPDVSVNLDVTVAPHGRFETDLPEEAAELIPEEAEAPEEEIGVTEPAEVQSESEAAEGESSEPEPQED
jgi:large subunit ribosomal protein L9